jgi:hypothetical protein
VAAQLIDAFHGQWPSLSIDSQAVLLGAALHDIGKVLHAGELTGPGRQHEQDGPRLLIDWGIAPQLARFAQTHGSWRTATNLHLEDLLVALADTCWKGSRDPVLEQHVADQLTAATGGDPWVVFIALDDIIEAITVNVDMRLAWQARFPVS